MSRLNTLEQALSIVNLMGHFKLTDLHMASKLFFEFTLKQPSYYDPINLNEE